MHRLFLILITLLSTNAISAEVGDLYQSYLDVSDQSIEQRENAAPTALNQVILKVVGDRAALFGIDLSSVYQQTDNLIQQYQYRRKNIVSEDLTLPDQLEVVFKFSEPSLNQQLSALGLPIWGKSRPEVLMLLIDSNSQQLVSEQTDQVLLSIVKNTANNRGLPIVFPVMDLEDQHLLSSYNLKTNDDEALTKVAQRYGAQVVVLATIMTDSNDVLTIDWGIHQQGSHWKTQGLAIDALDLGVNELTDKLAREFSQVISSNSGGESVDIVISNVKKYADYAQIMQYFSALQYVDDLALSEINNDELIVSLRFKGDLALLERKLAISQLITKDDTFLGSESLYYRFLD